VAVELPETTLTAEELAQKHNLQPAAAVELLALADAECRRVFAEAFREIPQATWDDCVRRVAGAVVGAKRRPAGSAGQQTTVEQNQIVVASRDYTAGIRDMIANYAPGGLA
jgi:hypothetical protein